MRRSVKILFVLFLGAFVLSCGKKGPPRWVPPETPPSPYGLSAVLREDEVVLMWNYPAQKRAALGEFVVMRAEDGDFAEIATTDDPIHIDRDIEHGKVYSYRVAATGKEEGMRSADSGPITVSFGVRPERPGKPFFRFLKKQVKISWDYPGKDMKFNIYKSGREGIYPLEPLNVEPLAVRTFTDGIEPEERRYYSVRAVGSGSSRGVVVEGPPSEEMSIGPEDYVPSMPGGLEAVVSGGKVLLYWDESPEPWVKGYRVYRARKKGRYKEEGRSSTPAFTDSAPPPGTVFYRVRAIGPAKDGPLSKPLRVTVQPQ